MMAPSEIPMSESILFFEDILAAGAGLRVKATGRSMLPFLRGGEILTIKKVPPSSLRMGDVIFFRRNPGGQAVVHRIVRKSGERETGFTFRTKGDALIGPDEPVSEQEILGKVCAVESGVRHANLEAGAWRAFSYLVAVIGLFKAESRAALRAMSHLFR